MPPSAPGETTATAADARRDAPSLRSASHVFMGRVSAPSRPPRRRDAARRARHPAARPAKLDRVDKHQASAGTKVCVLNRDGGAGAAAC